MAFEPIESQEALDEVIKDRLKREREKVKAEYADYDDLKKKAAAYDEAQEANKTELQKAQDRVAELEGAAKKREEADKQRELREKVAKEKGIPADLIVGTDEESMAAYADKIAEYAKIQTPAGAIDPTPGSFSGGDDGRNDEKRAFVRSLFGKEE